MLRGTGAILRCGLDLVSGPGLTRTPSIPGGRRHVRLCLRTDRTALLSRNAPLLQLTFECRVLLQRLRSIGQVHTVGRRLQSGSTKIDSPSQTIDASSLDKGENFDDANSPESSDLPSELVKLMDEIDSGGIETPSIDGKSLAGAVKHVADDSNRSSTDDAYLSNFGNDIRIPLKLLSKHTIPGLSETVAPLEGGLLDLWSQSLVEKHDYTRFPPRRPLEWSTTTFTDYVRQLARYHPPGSLIRPFLSDGQLDEALKTDRQVADAIATCLCSDELRAFFTAEGFNAALVYYIERPSLPHIRQIFQRMALLNLRVSTAAWNVMLSACARRDNLAGFTALLSRMLRAGALPNGISWALFVRTIGSFEIKQKVIDIMKRSGILDDPQASSLISTQMARYQFSRFVGVSTRYPKLYEHFIDVMVKAYGVGAMSDPAAGNKILEHTLGGADGNRGTVIQSLRLLPKMKKAGFRPDSVTWRLFLEQCQARAPGNKDLHVLIVSEFRAHWGIEANGLAQRMLFGLARRHGNLNMLRTVWTSLCLEGLVSMHIVSVFHRSLMKLFTASSPWNGRGSKRVFAMLGYYAINLPPRHGPWLYGSTDPVPNDMALSDCARKAHTKVELERSCMLAIMLDIACADRGYIRDGLSAALCRAAKEDDALVKAGLWNGHFTIAKVMKHRMPMQITWQDMLSFRKESHDDGPDNANDDGVVDDSIDQRTVRNMEHQT